jgi:hypothetical protein
MKLVIGGSIAIVIGVYGFATNFGAFLSILAAIIPLTLILGGCLAIYLNHETKSPEPELESKPLPEDTSTDKPADETPKLVGNTGSLVFHNLDCKFSKSEKCTASFNTREKAIQEGYKPCGICKP